MATTVQFRHFGGLEEFDEHRDLSGRLLVGLEGLISRVADRFAAYGNWYVLSKSFGRESVVLVAVVLLMWSLSFPANAQDKTNFPAATGVACVVNLEAEGEKYLTLREQPSASSGEVARLRSGQALSVTGGSGNWLSVEVLGEKAYSGWVNGKYTVVVDDASQCQGTTTAKADEPTVAPAATGVANDANGEPLQDRQIGEP